MAASVAPPTAATPLRDVDAARADPRRVLLLKAADAAPFAFIGAMWINQLASAAAVAARRACGEGSRAVGLAREAAYGAFLVMAALLPLAHQRMVVKLNSKSRFVDFSGWIVHQRLRFVPALIGLRRDGRVAFASVPVLVIFCCCGLILASLLIRWLAPPKGSGLEMLGAGLCDLGSFLSSVTMCSVILPNLIILLRASAT
ncbi:hypothetical protein HU200_036073 [Digitaria exilis]|uniref:Uncharacterized protein n=1 Tax=Digitaria exilis TaxID=1010633 RepID=A0A835BHM9_9POAL|nr:hypothetical protein HU200_036073 [Digitaria exilis]